MFEGIGLHVGIELQKLIKYPVMVKSSITYNSTKDYVVDCIAVVEYKGSMVIPKNIFDEASGTILDDTIIVLAKTIASDINNTNLQSDEIIINGDKYKRM